MPQRTRPVAVVTLAAFVWLAGCGADTTSPRDGQAVPHPDDVHWTAGFGPGKQGLTNRVDERLPGSVSCLLVHDGALVAGGRFTHGGPTQVNHVALWNGTAWSTLGSGVSVTDPRETPAVETLAELGGHIVAGGRFDGAGAQSARNVAVWDGDGWRPLGPGLAGRIHALTPYGGHLIAGGSFSARVARWDGATWGAMGRVTFCGPEQPDYVCWVVSLLVHDGVLVGSRLTNSAGEEKPPVQEWTGSSWVALSPDVDCCTARCLTLYQGSLIIGHESSGRATLVRWDGENWEQDAFGGGLSGSVYAAAVYGDDLVVAGVFDAIGGTAARNIARWNGSRWSPLGSGIDGRVSALAVHDGSLFAGGAFETAGGKPSHNIARWTDQLAADATPLSSPADGGPTSARQATASTPR